jgi:hypothetical protein
MPGTTPSHEAIRAALDEARKSAHLADQAIQFSDDAAQAAVHALADGLRHITTAVRALIPRAKRGRQ